MLRLAMRDLQWRRRRFAIATLGVALVFGLTLVITGVSTGFLSEANNTVSQMGASEWVVRQGADGPFLGSSPFAMRTAADVSGLPGVVQAVPTVYTHRDVIKGATVVSVNVYGAPTGNLGMPLPSQGRQPSGPHEILISTKLKGYPIGSHLLLAAHRFTVVGLVDDSTALAGTPNTFLTVRGAQSVAFAGLPVASAVAVRGTVPPSLPHGLSVVSNTAARDDLLRALGSARSSITLIALLLWLVAATVVTFASVFLGTGTTARQRFSAQLVISATSLIFVTACTRPLVTRYGLIGAAWSLLGGAAVEFGAYAILTLRDLREATEAPPRIVLGAFAGDTQQ